MAKFNTSKTKAANGKGFVGTIGTQTINHQGGTGFLRDEKSELFLAAVSDFMGNSFYESRTDRDSRTIDLIHKVAVNDPVWIANFTEWLRNSGNMRSISLMVALETAKAQIESKIPGARSIISSAIKRADEPGEALGYWMSRYGRKLPAAVKRGIADGAVATYNQYSVPKYDSDSKAFKVSDVIRLTHPKPKNSEQEALFKYAMTKRIDPSKMVPDTLTKIRNRDEIMKMDKDKARELITSSEGVQRLKDSGLTWEAVAGKVGLDKEIWESLIPNMGYMALLRNLRNFREAGVSTDVYNGVLDKLSDPDEVTKSKQFPFRFLSAYYANKDHLKTASALEDALQHSLQNVPSLPGKTLILVDRSGSMFPYPWYGENKNSELSNADKAALFGIALALRAENATLVEFGTTSAEVKFRKGSSILTTLKEFHDLGGTNTYDAMKKHYDSSYDRVINLTDEQVSWGYSPASIISTDTPYYIFNLAGYRHGEKNDGPNRYTFGGLTDQCFGLIPLLENGKDCNWPWIKDNF